jgi:hypothetical protein
VARRLLQRAHTTRSLPDWSRPVRWMGWAQNPTDSARCHHDSNPSEEARRTIWSITRPWSMVSGMPGNTTVALPGVLLLTVYVRPRGRHSPASGLRRVG